VVAVQLKGHHITVKTRNGLSLGFMESVTSCMKAEIDIEGDRSFQTVEPLTNYFAGRVSREFQKGNTIVGGMLTSTKRFNDDDHLDYLLSSALSGGFDFQQYFRDRQYLISFSTYMSRVNGSTDALTRIQRSPVHYFQRSDADHLVLDSTRTSLSGYGWDLRMGKQSGRFNFMLFLSANSPGLELNDLGFMTTTDEIFQIFWMGYRFNEPFSIFRRASININQWNVWDFGRNHQTLGINLNGHAEFKNLWNSGFYLSTDTDTHSNSTLRGGPSIILPGDFSASLFLSTSSRKKLDAEVDLDYQLGYEESGSRYGIEFGLGYKPVSNLNLSIHPEFSHRQRELQYVEQQQFNTEDRFIFGAIDQKTLSLSIRLDLILTPELTIQFWGQPFIATGDYNEFKYITDPKADSFGDRFRSYEPGEIAYDDASDLYRVSETASALNYEFENPDFNIKEFLANLVFRWEYRPGSFIYLVWSQSRSGFDPNGHFRLDNDFSKIWEIHPTDAILLKVSYRIGR